MLLLLFILYIALAIKNKNKINQFYCISAANPPANQRNPSGGGGSQNFGSNLNSTGVIAHTITGGQVGGQNSQYGGTRNIGKYDL